MKTTIELPDAIYRQAEALAARRGCGLGELIETGLRLALEAPQPAVPGQTFRAPNSCD